MILSRMLASCSSGALLLQPLVNPVNLLSNRMLNNKLYVGQLAENSTEDSVKQFYSQFGTIKAFKSVHESNLKHSLRHVVVSYSSKDELDTAMSQLPHVVDGSNVWVFPMPEALRLQPKLSNTRVIDERQEQDFNNKPRYELVISKLSSYSTSQSILDYYTKFDPDVKISLKMSEKIALIRFSSVEGLAKSVMHPTHRINGRRVEGGIFC